MLRGRAKGQYLRGPSSLPPYITSIIAHCDPAISPLNRLCLVERALRWLAQRARVIFVVQQLLQKALVGDQRVPRIERRDFIALTDPRIRRASRSETGTPVIMDLPLPHSAPLTASPSARGAQKRTTGGAASSSSACAASSTMCGCTKWLSNRLPNRRAGDSRSARPSDWRSYPAKELWPTRRNSITFTNQ